MSFNFMAAITICSDSSCFIDMQFTYPSVYPFKVYNLMFVCLFVLRYSLCWEAIFTVNFRAFLSPPKETVPIDSHSPILPVPQPLQPSRHKYFFFFSFLNVEVFFFKFYFIFKLYIIVLVLPYIKMNLPQVYMCSPSRTLLPPPSPYF